MGRRDSIDKGWAVGDYCEHLSEDIGDIDCGREVPEEFGRLPLHDSGEDVFSGCLDEVLDGMACFRSFLGKPMPQETRLDIRKNEFLIVLINLLSTLLYQVCH